MARKTIRTTRRRNPNNWWSDDFDHVSHEAPSRRVKASASVTKPKRDRKLVVAVLRMPGGKQFGYRVSVLARTSYGWQLSYDVAKSIRPRSEAALRASEEARALRIPYAPTARLGKRKK